MADQRFRDADVQVKVAAIDVSTSGDTALVAAVATKRICPVAILVIAAGTVSVKFKDGATDKTGASPFQAREGYSIAIPAPGRFWEGTANTALNINLSAAIQVTGFLSYIELD